METESKHRKVGILNHMAYGGGDIYGGGSYFIVSTFAMFYLVNVVGMPPLLAGLVPAIGILWDAISDPLMGYISDITPENRFGKRRVWFLVSIVPIGVSFTLIWLPVEISNTTGKFFFYVFTYLMFYTVSTISYVPYTALGAEMTHDSKERNILNGTRIFFSFFATILVGLLAKPIIDHFGGGRNGYFIMGIVFSLIFALPWITLYLGTWERPARIQEKTTEHFLKNFFSVFKNRTSRRHILMYVCSYGTVDVLMAWLLFFIVDCLKRYPDFVYIQGALILTMMAALPLYVYISVKKGHKISYILGLSLFIAGMLFMLLQGPETPLGLLIANVVLLGAGISAGILIPKQLMPFVADLDTLVSGRERAGTYAAAMFLSRKLIHAIVILNGLGILLNVIGYKHPVPTILAHKQYENVIELAGSDLETQSFLKRSFAKKADGNYHLRLAEDDSSSLSEDEIYRLREVLDEIGFEYTGIGDPRKVVQSESTVEKLGALFILLPILVALIGIIVAIAFHLIPRNHQIVTSEIKRLENGGKKEDVDPETRRVCEKLAGISYQTMYPK